MVRQQPHIPDFIHLIINGMITDAMRAGTIRTHRYKGIDSGFSTKPLKRLKNPTPSLSKESVKWIRMNEINIPSIKMILDNLVRRITITPPEDSFGA